MLPFTLNVARLVNMPSPLKFKNSATALGTGLPFTMLYPVASNAYIPFSVASVHPDRSCSAEFAAVTSPR
jgi:hypothetical protein